MLTIAGKEKLIAVFFKYIYIYIYIYIYSAHQITFDQAMSDDTYGMHDNSGTLLGRPPSQLVAWDPGFVESDKHMLKED